MLIFRKNQVVISSLIVVIVCAGYLNYKYNQSKMLDTTAKNPIGSAYFVDNYEYDAEMDNISVAQINGDYFIVAKAERERSRDEQKEILETIIENEKADKDAKESAQNQIIKLAQSTEHEMKIEGILKGKGFKDVVAFVDEAKADIIIRDTGNLLVSKQAVILDVVISETGLKAENIKISPYKDEK